ncbi:hypothetical protein D9758_005516 [Tetrapyrgos nigripes]|uniref:F-box domain-containing protein n=1 Tax=Tetrapyrgos nigripes TaxID=182062 RepID=A0A8H5GGI6_9AGAR|nr:hypothetical protein D9758_005516 [Tetrapyrgos nigripes]
MICPSCGYPKPYKFRFDFTNTSRVNEMLRTFAIPTGHSSVFAQMQVDAEEDVRHYDLEISELNRRVLYLEEKKKRLGTHMERLKSLSAPIRRLPVELLACIFGILCEGQPTKFSTMRIMQSCPPLSLSSVCSAWRQIAIDTSSLWCNLRLAHSARYFVPRFEPPLRLCLARSKLHPLSVHLFPGAHEDHPLVQLLAEQSSRWRTVETFDLSEMDFSTFNQKTFPLLEILRINDCFDDYPHLNFFNSAPRLHSLKVNRLPEVEALAKFTPRNQITHLEAACCNGEVVFQELEMFPNLQSMVYTELDHTLIPAEVSPQTLAHLNTVEFQLSDNSGYQCSHEHSLLKALMEQLTFPSLTNLTIKDVHCKGDDESYFFMGVWPRQTSADFLGRSGCSLQSLHLHQISLADEDLIALLMLNTSLVELQIKEICRAEYNFARCPTANGTIFEFKDIITPKLLTALHAYDNGLALSSPLVPKLESLHFVADGDLFDDELFWKMVMSRWLPEKEYALNIGVSSLRSVRICVLGRALKEDVEQRLRHLEMGGLKVSLRATRDDIHD